MHSGRRTAARRQLRQRGVFAILFAVLLPLMLTLLGFALGLAQMYNRKVELQGMANAVALAAARQLNGTEQGLEDALDQARNTAKRFKFDYTSVISWNASAITFSDKPDPGGSWSAADADLAGKLFYVKVDTAQLGGNQGLVKPVLIRFLSNLTTVRIDARAIAGRVSARVTPLAVCALSNVAATDRAGELVQYGYRRGVVYDLMKLNPGGDKGEHFTVDPVNVPGASSALYNTSAAAVGPFVCTGNMWMPSVTSGQLRVTRGFPLDLLYKQLNTRFDQYTDTQCNPNGAPPDLNITEFTGAWMSPPQNHVHTAEYQTPARLATVADQDAPPAGTTNKQWGALWAYAKAVKYSSYSDEEPEPPEGYETFSTADMGTLYKSGVGVSGYPLFETPPYIDTITSPENSLLAIEHRRVLHIPLLSCPVEAGVDVKAKALAVGKFFMTRRATATSVVAEFAGIASEQSVAGPVELFP